MLQKIMRIYQIAEKGKETAPGAEAAEAVVVGACVF